MRALLTLSNRLGQGVAKSHFTAQSGLSELVPRKSHTWKCSGLLCELPTEAAAGRQNTGALQDFANMGGSIPVTI